MAWPSSPIPAPPRTRIKLRLRNIQTIPSSATTSLSSSPTMIAVSICLLDVSHPARPHIVVPLPPLPGVALLDQNGPSRVGKMITTSPLLSLVADERMLWGADLARGLYAVAYKQARGLDGYGCRSLRVTFDLEIHRPRPARG